MLLKIVYLLTCRVLGLTVLASRGPIDSSHMPPGPDQPRHADGTAWMAFYIGAMGDIAAALYRSSGRPSTDLVLKFLEHYAAISDAMEAQGNWDASDGLYYDRLLTPGGTDIPVTARSIVSMIPMLAAAIVDKQILSQSITLGKGFAALLRRYGFDDRDKLRQLGIMRGEPGRGSRLLSMVGMDRLEKQFARLFDEDEFLSRYGLRALSTYHRDHPHKLHFDGVGATIGYEPAESTTAMFGGNSNWRGPLSFPLNYLVINALEHYNQFFGDDLTNEYRSGYGSRLTLDAVAHDLEDRLISIFLPARTATDPVSGVSRPADRPGMEGQGHLQRVLPRRQRGRPRRLPSDRLDGYCRRPDPSSLQQRPCHPGTAANGRSPCYDRPAQRGDRGRRQPSALTALDLPHGERNLIGLARISTYAQNAWGWSDVALPGPGPHPR